MRKKRVQKTYTVVDRYGRKNKITFRGTIEYVPYPSEREKEELYRGFVEASLRALANRKRHEKRKAKEG